MSPDLWVLITGILAAVSCGVIGSFLVLRQNAMLGDAISHSVLPGLVLAFLITASRDVLPMVIGAAVFGVATAYLTELLDRTRHVYRDGALGIVFTLLFAVGVILIAIYADQIDLDQDCVLYGEIAYTPWDVAVIGGQSYGPRAVWILGGVLIANVVFILTFYKQLKICSFDPAMARAVGINERFWHYALMTMVSLTVVAAFESVGAILVVAMLIVPGATAYLLTDRLSVMLVLSAVAGVISAVGGFYAANWLDASIAGSMAVVAGVLLAGVLIGVVIGRRLAARKAVAAAAAAMGITRM
ncbi:iron chelate uptake ABC transporter family permease subunit [candidate division GN15 bacterium]|nr:iron chelate uptake ABC transporter family permease subunit [candidate division GN15 bacterium]